MTLPKSSILQKGYRKEISFADETIYNITKLSKAQWSLDITVQNFNRNEIKTFGTFIVEYASWHKIQRAINNLPNQIINIDYFSNSNKWTHRWTTTVLYVQTAGDHDHSTIIPKWEIECAFAIPMSENITGNNKLNGSWISEWWNTDI